ncbi:hypothetical protein Bca4012_004806 [Brassica carinata]|uniref:Uncharacterized protein n=1 Tax=Brassica carinata TaxID=52824 RepID=A0A8X7UX43_BRACI|nr:hypothetical protein Bca52824_040761 [Brassica carinata]
MVKKTTKAQGKSSYGGSQDNTPIPHASSSAANKPTKRSACEQRRPWLHPRYLPLLIGNIFPEQADTGSDGRHARQARQLIRAAKRGQQPHQGMVHLIP